jgi:hypothetical protein
MPARRLATLLLALLAAMALPAPAGALDARWPGAEAYYRELLDCTRAGGWVREDGTCDTEDAEGRVPKREPLKLGPRLTADLARPYARTLARAGYLTHDLGGGIRARFERAGLGGGRIGENIGYAGGDDPKAAVLRIHRLFQAEWSHDGWHWRNMTDRRFTRVGIGVWVKDGRTYLVVDFHS